MKTRTCLQWAEFFGIEIVDADGFKSVHDKYTAVDFANGIDSCTIRVFNTRKYNNFRYIFG